MRLEYAIPDIAGLQKTYLAFHGDRLFRGDLFNSMECNQYVRKAALCGQAAVFMFEDARKRLDVFHTDRMTIHLTHLGIASSMFEACLSNTQLSASCLKRLALLAPPPFAPCFGSQPLFDEPLLSQIRLTRNTIQHADERIEDGKFGPSDAIALAIDGPTVKQGDDEVRTFDRVSIGVHSLMLTDIADLLTRITDLIRRLNEARPS